MSDFVVKEALTLEVEERAQKLMGKCSIFSYLLDLPQFNAQTLRSLATLSKDIEFLRTNLVRIRTLMNKNEGSQMSGYLNYCLTLSARKLALYQTLTKNKEEAPVPSAPEEPGAEK